MVVIIIGLVIGLLWAYVVNERTENVLKKTRDLLLSMTTGKKMIVKKNYLRKEDIENYKLYENPNRVSYDLLYQNKIKLLALYT